MNLATWLTTIRDSLHTALQALGTPAVARLVQDDSTGVDKVILWRPAESGIQQQSEWVVIGNQRYDSTYLIPGRILTYYTADDVTDTDPDAAVAAGLTRCETLLDELVGVIRSNPPALGDQTFRVIVSDRTWQTSPADKGGWITVLDYQLSVESRHS
jgi:hypothetical protein